MYSPSNPANASDCGPAPSAPPTTTSPPNTKEEYEAAAQAQRRKTSSNACIYIYIVYCQSTHAA